MNSNRYSLILPTIHLDFAKFGNNSKWLFEFLPIKEIVVIGPNSIANDVSKLQNSELIRFIAENEIVSFDTIKQIMVERVDNEMIRNRVGWYLQQFIKMEYSKFCTDEYYIVWDSDTIPTSTIELFSDEGKPYFDLKTEHHMPYFETLKRILPGVCNIYPNSFISEHMVIHRKTMELLIQEIESSPETSGTNFF